MPGGTQALVVDQGRLKIVDLTAKTVKPTSVSGLNASRLVINASGTAVLVANQSELDSVDLSTWTKTTIATGFTALKGIALESSGLTALVSDNGPIYRVTLSSGQSTLVAYGASGDIAIEPSGTTVLSTNGTGPVGFGHGLVRIDLQTGVSTVIAPITVRGDAVELAPDGSFALMVASISGGDTGIAKIDLSTDAITQLAGGSSAVISDLALTPDGSQVLSTWNMLGGYAIQATTVASAVTNTLIYAGSPQVYALESSGSTIIGPNGSSSSLLYRIALASGKADQLGASGASPSDFVLLSGGTEALVVSHIGFGLPGTLYRINTGTGQITSSMSIDTNTQGIAVESSGSTALMTVGSDLVRIDLSTGVTTPIAEGLTSPVGVAIEDSGTSVLVGSLFGVYQVNLSDGSASLVTNVGARYVAIEPGMNSAILEVESTGLSRLDLTTLTVTPLATGIHVTGKVAIETGDSTALAATDTEGIVRVRIR